MKSRSALFLATLSILAVTVSIGCGGSAATPESPLELLKRAAKVMVEVDGFRSQTVMELEDSGQRATVFFDMEIAARDNWKAEMRVEESGSTVQQVDLVVVASDTYLKPPRGGWSKMSSGEYAALTGQPPESLQLSLGSQLFSPEDTPWHLWTVESLGREVIDGVDLEHLRISGSFQEIYEAYGPEVRDELLGAVLGGDNQFDPRDMEFESIDIWIDHEGYQHKMVLDLKLGAAASSKITIIAGDFGDIRDIERPIGDEESSQVSPAPTAAWRSCWTSFPTRSAVLIDDYALLRELYGVPLPGPDADVDALQEYVLALCPLEE